MTLKNRFVKWTMTILLTISLLLIIGFIYERIGRNADMKKYPPVGETVEYDGEKIHYINEGSGDGTVVFTSGSGTSSPYADMYHLQEEISSSAEAIIYERPGYGWSDTTSLERSISNITDEMEAIITAASENNAYIFVGHSMAALEIFAFAQKYPEKVKGIVLIDGVNPDYASQMGNLVPISIHGARTLKNIGGLRLYSKIGGSLIQNNHLPESKHDQAAAITLDKMWNSTMIAERKALNRNGESVTNGGKLRNIPLVIFSAAQNPMEGWADSQEQLTSWSENAKQIWIDTDNHFIHYEEPDRIIREIDHLLE
ncbi:alpha/beta fold hydrolase [Lentibacillus salinarum]|uniref:Alpha/beta fold hydrolase n=1 Tax=Lentibacillus salinarum TaxID=446820 RepID=A0ABW3ZTS9_9BACI